MREKKTAEFRNVPPIDEETEDANSRIINIKWLSPFHIYLDLYNESFMLVIIVFRIRWI